MTFVASVAANRLAYIIRHDKSVSLEDLVQQGVMVYLENYQNPKYTPAYPWDKAKWIVVQRGVKDYLVKVLHISPRTPRPLSDIVVPVEHDFNLEREDLLHLLGRLHARYRDLLVALFYDGREQQEYAAELGLSKARMTQLKEAALENLRHEMELDHG